MKRSRKATSAIRRQEKLNKSTSNSKRESHTPPVLRHSWYETIMETNGRQRLRYCCTFGVVRVCNLGIRNCRRPRSYHCSGYFGLRAAVGLGGFLLCCRARFSPHQGAARGAAQGT